MTVPYIKAGLEDNEFCMWITGDPITENDAFQALEQVLPNAHRYFVDKQLEVFPHTQWYLPCGIFDAGLVLGNWLSKSKHVREKDLLECVLLGVPSGSRLNRMGAIRSIQTSGHSEHPR